MTFDCTGSADFGGLTDAYTGRPLRVEMETTPRGVMFRAPGARSPRRFYASMAEARRILGPELRCKYTGEPLRPVGVDGAVMFTGGFDPCRFAPKEEFLRFARSRGEAPAPAPDHVHVAPVVHDPMPLSRETPVTQEAIDAMKELVSPKRRRRK